jgi:predicted nucleic acid-binding protein
VVSASSPLPIAVQLWCVVVSLDTTIALLAADLHREHKLATADAIVYATAPQQGIDLLTCDGHFEGLHGVTLFSKAAQL